MQMRTNISSRQKQGGAALVIGLLLLLVLTLLAVSSMNTASTELAMAGNTQFQQNAFQAAETGIAQGLRTGAFNPAIASEAQNNVSIAGTSDFYSNVITPAMGGIAQPALWGSSWDAFSTFHFQIQSTGTGVRNARAVNVQGVAIIAPKDPTVAPIDPSAPALTP